MALFSYKASSAKLNRITLAESETSDVYFDSSSISINSNQAIFYEHSDFRGQSFTMTPGQVKTFKGDWWNDRITSFRIGSGVRVQLCKHSGCGDSDGKPGYVEFVGPIQVNGGFFWNDEISGIYAYPYDAKNKPRITVFADSRFRGYSQTFEAGSSATPIYQNTLDRYGYKGDGGISSIVVPEGVVAILYDKDQLTGNKVQLVGPQQISSLSSSYNFNDKTKSMVIFKAGTFAMRGYWKLILSSNDDISTTITQGYTITNGQETTETIGSSVTTSVESGFEFEGVSAKVSVSSTSSHEVATSVSETMSRTTEYSITAGCDSQNGEQVGLWQWQMSGIRPADSAAVEIKDQHYQCRRGSNAGISPRCPPGWCAENTDCSSCTNSALYA